MTNYTKYSYFELLKMIIFQKNLYIKIFLVMSLVCYLHGQMVFYYKMTCCPAFTHVNQNFLGTILFFLYTYIVLIFNYIILNTVNLSYLG